MNRFALLCLGLVLMLPGAALADHPSGATEADIRMLQDDLENLDDTLDLLEGNDARTTGFRRREREIHDEITRLGNQIERHRRNQRAGLGASKADVDNLRRRIQALQNDVDRSYSGSDRFPTGAMTLPEGTQIHVRLEQSISSRTARVEDRVEALVELPVRDSSGRVLIPAGSRLVGSVTNVQRAQRPARGGELQLAFDTLYVGNRRMDIRSRVVSIDQDLDRGDTATRAGIGAILGGVLGGILEGKTGALIGLIIGGTGGVVSSRGDEVELPAGTVMTLSLDRAISVDRF